MYMYTYIIINGQRGYEFEKEQGNLLGKVVERKGREKMM